MERSAAGERIKVTRYGRTLAALIPKSDLTKLEDCEKGGPPGSSVSRTSASVSAPLPRRRRKPA